MSNNKSNRFIPLWLALAAIVGIVVGTFYGNHFQGNRLNIINAGSNKLTNLLYMLDDQYVDSVDVPSLVEKAIPLILGELDPHSVYISANDVEMANDDLRGSFSGVGIEFIIRNDTLRVQNVISDGPAERAGLIAGDKIVTVDDSAFTGKDLTNELAMHKLKGPQGTKVKLGVVRYGEQDIRDFTVTRDQILTHSVTAAYMLDETTGYIRIKSFSDNTYEEMVIALAQLSMEGFNQLVVDLRGNTGGYLHSAVDIANQFLPRDRLIVYTEVAARHVRNIAATATARISTCRWWCSSTRDRPRPARFWREPSRTTTVAPSSADAPSARDWCSSPYPSPTTR